MTESDAVQKRNSNRSLLLALALQSFAVNTTADELQLPADVTTVEDGRAGIQDLYASFGSLRERGWLLDVIARSQPDGTRRAMPIIALRTAASGPAIWIISGIHGEEPAGPNAIAGAIDAIAEAGAHRPVVLVPLANPHGYVRNWRYLNTPTWSQDVEEQSVGDSSHLLARPENPAQARAPAASSPEADAITAYLLETARHYPPLISIDLHEDDKISAGYVYSQGERGDAEPLASAAVDVLRELGIAVRMDGLTRFDEPISAGIVGPVTDSSIDELMSAREVIAGGATAAGPAAPVVLVFETPAAGLPLARRIAAHEAVLRQLLGAYRDGVN